MISVSVVEDSTVALYLLSKMLKGDPLFTQVSGYNSMEEFFKDPPANPQVVLLDIVLPEMDGLEGAFRIRQQYPGAAILMLTSYEDPEKVFKAFQAGADGYILKSASFEKLKAAIIEVSEGGFPMSPTIAKMVISHFSSLHGTDGSQTASKISPSIPLATSMSVSETTTPTSSQQLDNQGLTQRELEISKLLNNGFTYKQVAYYLKISMDTVRGHVKNIYRKLRINSRSELMRDYRL